MISQYCELMNVGFKRTKLGLQTLITRNQDVVRTLFSVSNRFASLFITCEPLMKILPLTIQREHEILHAKSKYKVQIR